MSTDAKMIAALAADAVLGTLKIGFSDGMKLSGLYKRYAASPSMVNEAVDHLAQELCERSPLTAGLLCDAISKRIGK